MTYTPPERTPPKPDPSITPTTMKGNYPRHQRQPSKTPHTMSWPMKRERGTDHGGGSPMFTIPQWILRLIDWLNGKVEIQYETLLVRKHSGNVGVKHWGKYLFFAENIVGFYEDGSPMSVGLVVVSRFDSNGDKFDPAGVFEVRNKKGKINGVPYEWQPIAEKSKPKQKHTTEQMATLDELFDDVEDETEEQGRELWKTKSSQ